MKRFRRGLVVGKFSPLHQGHELLISTAHAACDGLLVLSYSVPELPRCGADARERWLRARCPEGVDILALDATRLAALCTSLKTPPLALPSNDADELTQRLFVATLLRDVLGHPVDAVFTSETYGDGFASVLAKQFGEPVEHVCVDLRRRRVPVSGTAVRQDPEAWRGFVAPEVYADLLPRLCLLGGESSGKTTLARALAERLGTVWVPEYGRERWEAVATSPDFVIDPRELLHIAQTQVQREIDAAQQAHRWLVCDTSPLTTLHYCLLDHGEAPAELHRLAARPYDLAVLCDGDFAFVQDGTRRSDAFRAEQQARTMAALDRQGGRWLRVQGTVEARVEQVLAALGRR